MPTANGSAALVGRRAGASPSKNIGSKSVTQTQKILAHLQAGKAITPIQALSRFRCFRLAARIAELRGQGHDISTATIKRKDSRYASYRLG
jgi:hypothetical protein